MPKLSSTPTNPVISGALTLSVYELAETEFFLWACQDCYAGMMGLVSDSFTHFSRRLDASIRADEAT